MMVEFNKYMIKVSEISEYSVKTKRPDTQLESLSVKSKLKLAGLLTCLSTFSCPSAFAGNMQSEVALSTSMPLQLTEEVVTNDAPCGVDTIAIINTAQNDQYTFCADGEGTAVMELLYDDGERESLLDKITDPIDLLATVTPAYVDIPSEVLVSIAEGQSLQNAASFVVGKAAYIADTDEVNLSSKAACSTPSLGFSISEFVNSTTYCDFVSGTTTSSGNSNWHHHWASAFNVPGEGSHSHAGPHEPFKQWFADEDEEGDARYGRARVRSCGGTTLFRGWKKASPTTGSWSPIATYHVPSGYLYTMKWYSNSQHSIWMGYDADDIRFRADALGNASFGSRFYFLKYAWGTSCNLKY